MQPVSRPVYSVKLLVNYLIAKAGYLKRLHNKRDKKEYGTERNFRKLYE